MPNPIIIIAIIVAVVLLIALIASAYMKAAPDEAIIISGWRKEPKVLIGHAGFRIPFIERADTISLKLMTITLNKTDPIPTKDYIKVTVDAVVTAKVSDTPDGIKAAAQNFLNMQTTGTPNGMNSSKRVNGISDMIDNILDGSLREIIGQINLEDLVRSRDDVTDKVTKSATKDLNKLGIILETFNIQKFEDTVVDTEGRKHSMIESMGAEKTATILRDSAISRANAEADRKVAESEANKRANDARVKSELEIAQQNNELAVKQAKLKQIEDTNRAIADAAYEIQKQEQQKTINVAAAEAEVAKEEKNIEIRERLVAVRAKELEAEVEKKADADKKAAVLRADAELYQKKTIAEAKRYEKEQEAEAIKATAEAEKQAKFAEAAGVEAMGNAEAEAVKARGLAEAAALEKKADAMNKFGEAAITQMQLETAQAYIKVLPSTADAVTRHMERIGNVTIFGKENTAGFAGEGINVLSQVSSVAKETLGFDLKQIGSAFLGSKLAQPSASDIAEKITGMKAAEAKTDAKQPALKALVEEVTKEPAKPTLNALLDKQKGRRG